MLLTGIVGASAQGNLTKFLPNDHDGWQNLTYGVADSTANSPTPTSSLARL